MSLKRVLGAMLASRVAGRGRTGGSLGTAAMLAALAGRRGMGGKLGLAALGYMAYRAYRDQQAGAGRPSGRASAGTRGRISDPTIGSRRGSRTL